MAILKNKEADQALAWMKNKKEEGVEPKDMALQWMKENQDRDVSGMEAANPPKKTISSVFKDIVKYPRGDKVMAYSDRKIQDESFIEESKKDLEHAYGGKYDVMEGDRLITMRLALEDLASGKIDAIKFEEIKEDFLLEFPEEAIKVLMKDIKEDGFTKPNNVPLTMKDKITNKAKRFAFEAKEIGYSPSDLGKALIKEEKKTRKESKSEEGKLKVLQK